MKVDPAILLPLKNSNEKTRGFNIFFYCIRYKAETPILVRVSEQAWVEKILSELQFAEAAGV